MTARRRSYTAEFKESAVRLVTEQGYPVAEAARNLGINANMLSRWKKSMEEAEAVNGEPVTRGEKDKELTRLKKENARLRQEREILKKATVFFAQEPGNGTK